MENLKAELEAAVREGQVERTRNRKGETHHCTCWLKAILRIGWKSLNCC